MMRSTCLAISLVVVLSSGIHAQEPVVTPFWQRPQAALDRNQLAPTDIKLVSNPDRWREMALLQIGSDDPRNYISKASGAETPCRVVNGGLQIGASTYVDRPFTITKLPEEFVGLSLLQTVLQHKAVVDGRFAIVVSMSKPGSVFVALDETALETYKKHGVPAWLQEYAPTGRQLVTDRATYAVFVKQAFPGRIVLGPPSLDAGSNAMYFAFFAQSK